MKIDARELHFITIFYNYVMHSQMSNHITFSRRRIDVTINLLNIIIFIIQVNIFN